MFHKAIETIFILFYFLFLEISDFQKQYNQPTLVQYLIRCFLKLQTY